MIVEAVESTLPDDCSPLQLVAPDGSSLAEGCIVNGKGTIDATALPVTGTYELVLDPSDRKTGTARLRVHN